MLYTGLDYHRSFSYITTMNDKGEIISQKKLPSNGQIIEFLKEFDDSMEVAIEATPSWYWLYDQLIDIEKRNINMREGCTAVGKMITSQMGRFRPFPELSRYKTPIENLYICGAGTHPGIGTGRPNSYNCFKIIAEDFGLKKIWEEKGRRY